MSLHIDQIRIDGGTQSRAAINEATVAEYVEAMEDPNTVFPPVVVYHDGKDYWLADGFHRLAAWKSRGRTDIPTDIRQGDRRRAILHSVAANSAHGLRRTNEDKRRAVLTLLEDEEWSQWSDREIARRCAVHHEMVGRLRGSHLAETPDSGVRTVERNGTVYQQNTAKIGAASKPAQEEITPAPQQTLDKTHEQIGEGIAPSKPDQDPHAAERRKLAGLPRQALEDDVIGLRAAFEDERAKRKAAEATVATLKARIKEFEQASDLGRALGDAQRQIEQIRGRMREIEAKAAQDRGRAVKLEAEIKRLRSEEITL